MELKAKLKKPYIEEEKINFIVENNHRKGYQIKDTETQLEAWGYTKAEQEEQRRETLNLLSLTKREVFLAIFNDKKITPEQIRSKIKDEASLIEFDYANDYFRGNPLIDQLGKELGYTTEQLDYLFENGHFEEA